LFRSARSLPLPKQTSRQKANTDFCWSPDQTPPSRWRLHVWWPRVGKAGLSKPLLNGRQ
jgi:hypothetical protein